MSIRRNALVTVAVAICSSLAFAEPSEKGGTAGGVKVQAQPGQAAGGGFQFDPAPGIGRIAIRKNMDGDTMTTTINEDEREITVTEGDDGISVDIKEGSAEPKSFKARDADALKNDSPEAFELYNRYCVSADKGGGMMMLGDPAGHVLRAMGSGKAEVLGIRVEPMSSEAMKAQIGEGVAVLKVKEGLRGEKLGLKAFDYIKSVNGREVASAEELVEALADKEKLTLEVLREGKPVTLSE